MKHKITNVAILLLLLGLCSGCATMTLQETREKCTQWQAEIGRFNKIQGIPYSDVPELYDVSRLKAGSTVKIKLTYGKSTRGYFTTKTLKDVKSTESGTRYIVNEIIANDVFLLEGEPSAFSKVVCEDKINYADFAKTYQDNVPLAIVKGGLMGLGDCLFMQGVNKQVAQNLKDHKIETKILNFKALPNEELVIYNQTISCRVYQIRAVTRETFSYFTDQISDQSIKVWISDDVPFGLVRNEIDEIIYNSGCDVKTHQTFFMGTKNMTEKWEVVEFKY